MRYVPIDSSAWYITRLSKKENHTMTNGMNPTPADQFAQTEQEKEPMLLLDTTGSMNFGTSENDSTPRRDTIREAISIIVTRLAAADSQAGQEAESGALRTVPFPDAQAHQIGNLNPPTSPPPRGPSPPSRATNSTPGLSP